MFIRKGVSLLMALVLCALLPMAASAETASPVISLGAASVAPGNTVWFGSNRNNYSGYYPLATNWRVLTCESGKTLLITCKNSQPDEVQREFGRWRRLAGQHGAAVVPGVLR